jgi:hypothetical protein
VVCFENQWTFRRNISPQSSGSKKNQARNQHEAGSKQATCFMLVSSVAYSTLKMEAICSSETSIDFQRITLRCIAEDKTF